MALVRTNTLEGGTAGSAVTNVNSGGASGNAFNGVNTPAGATNTYVSSPAYRGALALDALTNTSSSVQNYVVWTGLALPASALRFYFRFASMPGGAVELIQVANVGTILGKLFMTTTGALGFQNAAGTTVWSSTSTLTTNTWYRFELGIAKGTGTADGTLRFGYAVGDAALAEQFNSTTANAGTLNIERWTIGKLSSTWSSAHLYFDDFAVSDTSAFIGPSTVPNVAPTVNAGPDQTNVEPWSTVTLTATAADADGTTPTVSWAQTAGAPTVTLAGSGATRTYEAPGTIAGTTLTFTATASDGTLSATDPMTVAVLPVTERAVIGGVEVPMRIRST